jgi:hypothetical protein
MVRSSKYPDGAASVGEVISDSSDTLAALFRHAKSLTRVESLLASYISPELADQFQVAAMRRDRLVLQASAACWATRLRMQAEQLLQFLRASGYDHLRHIDIRVAPLQRQAMQGPVRRRISPAAQLALSLMSRLSRDPGEEPGD